LKIKHASTNFVFTVVAAVGLLLSFVACEKKIGTGPSERSNESGSVTSKQPGKLPTALGNGPGFHCQINGRSWESSDISATVVVDEVTKAERLVLVFAGADPSASHHRSIQVEFELEGNQFVSIRHHMDPPDREGGTRAVKLTHDESQPRVNGLNWARGSLDSVERDQLTGTFECLLVIGRADQKWLDDTVESEVRIKGRFVELDWPGPPSPLPKQK